MGRTCSMDGEKRNAYRILAGKPEGNNHWEYTNVGGRIIVQELLRRSNRLLSFDMTRTA
jgi:hypothetical protein